MKKYIILFSVLMLALTQTNAQAKQKHNKTEKKEQRKEQIKNLNLTQEQQAQIKSLNASFRQKAKDLKANDNMTLGEYKQKLSSLKQERKVAFESILTTEQKNQLAAEKTKLQQEHKTRMAARFDKMKAKLQLTQDQETKLKTKRADIEQQVATIKSNNSLTLEQKKEQIKSLKISQKEYLKTILTQEQLEKLEQRKKVK